MTHAPHPATRSGSGDGTRRDRALLYLAPGFLSYRVHKHVRGVQVFDVQLIRQLVGLGFVVTLPAESSWKPRMAELLGDVMVKRGDARQGVEMVWTPTLRKPLWNSLWAAAALGITGRRWDVAYIGNAGEGLATGAGAMHRLGVFRRLVVMTHRYPKRRLISLVQRCPSRTLAVSGTVECMFPRDLKPACVIRFGEMDHDLFYPPAPGERVADGLVHFVMLGALDTPLKDVPTAIEAFATLPDDVRSRCRLHLASFGDPPEASTLPAGVTAYRWMPIDAIPAFLRRMDVMLVTSKSETFCLALVQGMLTGMPSVVREMGTLSEKVDPGGGLTFTTVQELRDHMLALATDPARRERMGEIARRTALERFTWDTPRFVREFIDVDSSEREAAAPR
jgi:glycosyltransferase involved in cell wall biosynthesis